MNMVQETFLDMLRNPVFKRALFSPTVWYLVKKLQMDIVSPYVQGYGDGEMLMAIGEKLREKERLLTYELIRFYRTLRQDELLTESQLRRLEDDAFRPNPWPAERTTCIELPKSEIWSDPLTMLVTSYFRQPLPLPWIRDPDFFEKHPKHKTVLIDISDREDMIDWYRQVWLAVVEKFPW